MDYFIMVNQQKVFVTEAVYKEWCRGERKERYFREGDAANGLFSYDALDTDEYSGCDLFADTSGLSVEAQAERHLLYEQLRRGVGKLAPEERDLILRLYVYGQSLRGIARERQIPLSTLQYRHQRVLKKLKKDIEHMFWLPD